jgi:hypothetical protein
MVGVGLDPPADDLTTWLADASAFEAAGADALWIDYGTDVDQLVLTAALAAVTYRSLLIVRVPEPLADRTREALERLSRGRLRIVAARPPGWLAVPVPESRAAWRAALAEAAEAAALTEAAEAGVDGVLVPADPRLLDLLRNPDVVTDRSDLYIAQG